MLALTTIGRRTGKRRTTTLAYLSHGEGYAVTALNLGSDRHPAWCLNLRAEPLATVHVEGGSEAVRAREATGAEAEQLWRRFIDRLPQTGNARRVTARDVPVVVLERSAAIK